MVEIIISDEASKGVDVQSALINSYEAVLEFVLERPLTGALYLFLVFFVWQLPWVAFFANYVCCVRPNFSSLWPHEREA